MRRKLFNVFIVVFCFLQSYSFAQSTSNKGTDFWVAYAGHIDGLSSRMTLFLSSDVNTTYTVKVKGVSISSGSIVANVVKAVFIDPNLVGVYIGSSDITEINKAINVTAANPIAVYSVISNNARTGSTLVLPTASLEKEYYVFSYENKGSSNSAAFSEFTIVGTQDNTTIEIIPTQTSRNNTRLANVPFQITLNKGDIYQYQSVNDLSGTHLKTVSGCNAFGVFSGTTWSAYCETGNSRIPNGGDNLYQQLFPVTSWGRNFVSAPFFNTLHGNTDVIRIIVAEDNTTVNINGSTSIANGVPLQNPYRKGSMITFFSNTPNIIKSSGPIAVAQYQTSQTCNINNDPIGGAGGAYLGDPEMTILNPIEQTLKDITVYSRLNSVAGVNTNILNYYLNVIIKTADIAGFTLDGASKTSSFVPIPSSDYSYAVIDVTQSQAQHRLKADGGFTAIAYGYGNVESYAYLAGTDLKNLKANIQVFKKGNSVPASNFCLGNDYDVVLQLPYITNKITWDFNEGKKIEVQTSPAYTTGIVDGETVYFYKYSIPGNDIKIAGTYNLKAKVTNPSNSVCISDEEIFTSFEVFAPAFTNPAEVCINAEVDFTDISSDAGGTILSWLWDFGDGTKSTLKAPKHAFKTSGIKTVTLSVTTSLGCTVAIQNTVKIIAAPESKFSTTGNLCINSKVSFVNESTPTNTNIVATKWEFGDNQTALSTDATHSYSAAGNYMVKLISTSQTGCIDTLIKQITISKLPEISFKDPGSCVNDVVKFESAVVSGDIVSWLWDFGDGIIDATQNTLKEPQHKYAQVGTYLVNVKGKSAAGCETSFSKQIVINGNNPSVAFDVKDKNSLCAKNEVVFQNNSTVGFGKITKIEWIYDYQAGATNVKETDDAPTFGKLYTHKYPDAPTDITYQVVMIAYSGQLCFIQSAPLPVTVHASPALKFEDIKSVCEDAAPFQLVASELNGVAGVASFSGTGVSATGIFDPKISGPGSFDIKYTFSSTFACAEEKTIKMVVNPLPTVDAGADIDILLGGEKPLLSKAKGTGLKYKWSPSTGLNNDAILNPVVSPKVTTKYTLTITSESCTVVDDILVTVHADPVIPNVFSPNGDGKNDTWAVKYLETFVNATVDIFNRFGQKVFSSAQYTTPWDGKFNGVDVPVGVYYYIIEPNNGRKKYTGSITLLR